MSPKSVTDHIYKRKGLFRKAKIQKGPDRGAIYIGNLPYGFYEEAIEKFFGQFGRITNLKVARSLKNAKPMGYAYIEFECEKVAEVVCKTMDKYLMYNKILKCSFIPSNALNSKMFRNSDLTPEFCRGTIQKINNQYEMVQSRGEKYEQKQKKKALKAFNFLKHTLGVKVESDLEPKKSLDTSEMELQSCRTPEPKKEAEPQKRIALPAREREASAAPKRRSKGKSPSRETPQKRPLTIEIEDIDEEIIVKTPPNVLKRVKRGEERVICDPEATTAKKPSQRRSRLPLDPVSLALFSGATKRGASPAKRRKSLPKHSKASPHSQTPATKQSEAAATPESLQREKRSNRKPRQSL